MATLGASGHVEPLDWQPALLSALVALGAAVACLFAGWAARARLWWSARDLL